MHDLEYSDALKGKIRLGFLFQFFEEIQPHQQNRDGYEGEVEGRLTTEFSKNITGNDGACGAAQSGKNDDESRHEAVLVLRQAAQNQRIDGRVNGRQKKANQRKYKSR